jgi:hypothetical protein
MILPYTPGTNLLYGLRESLKMLLEEEGLDNVFRRHIRHAEATRQAVRTWSLEIQCLNPAEYSSSLTAVQMPAGHSEIAFRKVVLEHFDMSLGSGLGKVTDKVFRIGHLGDFNDLMLLGTLAGVEMGLEPQPAQERRAAAAMTTSPRPRKKSQAAPVKRRVNVTFTRVRPRSLHASYPARDLRVVPIRLHNVTFQRPCADQSLQGVG